MKRKFATTGAALVCALSLVSPPARAQSPADRATARHLMDEGDAWVERKRLDKALEAYDAADTLMHVPTTAIEVARTLEALGRLVEARDKALEIGRSPGAESESRAFGAARREAAQLAQRLEARIPTLRLDVTGISAAEATSVRASVDDEAIPDAQTLAARPMNPGRHTVQVRAQGRTPVTKEVELKEGARAVVGVDLALASAVGTEAVPERPSGGMPTEAIAGLGVAGAGLLIGSITGLLALSNASDARRLCGKDPKNCDPAANDAIDASRTLGWTSTIAFGVALAGGGVATYFLLSSKSDAPKTRDATGLRVVVTGAGAAVRGSF